LACSCAFFALPENGLPGMAVEQRDSGMAHEK
jgi:hypothetical protein